MTNYWLITLNYTRIWPECHDLWPICHFIWVNPGTTPVYVRVFTVNMVGNGELLVYVSLFLIELISMVVKSDELLDR